MIVVNTDFVPKKEVAETLGLVRGNTIQAKSIGKDFKAGAKGIRARQRPVRSDRQRGRAVA